MTYAQIAKAVNADFGLPRGDGKVTVDQVREVAASKTPSSHPVEQRVEFYLKGGKSASYLKNKMLKRQPHQNPKPKRPTSRKTPKPIPDYPKAAKTPTRAGKRKCGKSGREAKRR